MPRTESQITLSLLKSLRAAMPEAMVFKHTDLRHGGMPDFSVTVGERTTWWEAKRQGEKLTPLQRATMSRLRLAYIIYYFEDGSYTIVKNPGPTEFVPRNKIVRRMMQICKGELDV